MKPINAHQCPSQAHQHPLPPITTWSTPNMTRTTHSGSAMKAQATPMTHKHAASSAGTKAPSKRASPTLLSDCSREGGREGKEVRQGGVWKPRGWKPGECWLTTLDWLTPCPVPCTGKLRQLKLLKMFAGMRVALQATLLRKSPPPFFLFLFCFHFVFNSFSIHFCFFLFLFFPFLFLIS